MNVPRRAGISGDERAWIEHVRDGDLTAFETLFTAYYEPLYRYVGQIVRSRDEAEEIVQDLFAVLWARRRELPRFATNAAVKTYLYRSTRNRVFNRSRHASVVKRLTTLDPNGDTPPGIAGRPVAVDEALVATERQRAVRDAVAALPKRLREVLTLRADHAMTYGEIAATLGLSVKTVEGHVRRAFQTLRRSLAHLVE